MKINLTTKYKLRDEVRFRARTIEKAESHWKDGVVDRIMIDIDTDGEEDTLSLKYLVRCGSMSFPVEEKNLYKRDELLESYSMEELKNEIKRREDEGK